MLSGYEQRHRRPLSLRVEQLAGESVTRAAEPIPVSAWVFWGDGVIEQIEGEAQEWTRRAVHVRWQVGHRLTYEAWVWAGAVRRLRAG